MKFTDLMLESEKSSWEVVNGKLTKTYKFENYREVKDFVNLVMEIAEEQNHHPDMIVKFDSVKLIMFDHEAKDITERCYKFTNAVDEKADSTMDLDERSRSFAFTRKKRLFSYPEVNSNPMRYKKSERIRKNIDK